MMKWDLSIIRTALFVPGDRPERVDKALNTGADAVIIDLEDAVALSKKEEARKTAREKLQQFGQSHFMIVRVNSGACGLLDADLDEVVVDGIGGIMLPKVESGFDIKNIDEILSKEEKKKGLVIGDVLVFPLIESARGIQNISSIFTCENDLERVFTVAFGAADYTLDMGIEITADGVELMYPRSRIAVACQSAGLKPPLDTPFMIDIKNVDMLKDDALRAKQLGFGGKLCIHPVQIEPCNQIFSPTKEEIEHARKVIKAFEDAEKSGVAAVQLEGKFIDYPVFKRSKSIVELTNQLKL